MYDEAIEAAPPDRDSRRRRHRGVRFEAPGGGYEPCGARPAGARVFVRFERSSDIPMKCSKKAGRSSGTTHSAAKTSGAASSACTKRSRAKSTAVSDLASPLVR